MDVQYLSPGQTPGHGMWSAIVWHSEANTVDQSWQLWRGCICYYARRASYRNGSLESSWKMVGQQWIDSSSCSRWHINSWKGWLFFKGVACIQNKTCTAGHSCSTLHSYHMLKNIMILLIILTSGDNWKKTKIHNLNSGVWHSRFSYQFLCSSDH